MSVFAEPHGGVLLQPLLELTLLRHAMLACIAGLPALLQVLVVPGNPGLFVIRATALSACMQR